MRVAIVAVVLLISATAFAASPLPPACVRENNCAFTPCYGAPTGAVHYVCDCSTNGNSHQQPAAGCTAGNDANAGTSPSAPWKSYNKIQSTWGSQAAGDQVLVCNGGVLDLTGASSDRFVNRNGTPANHVVLGTYAPPWGSGSEGRPKFLVPLSTNAINFDDGSDISRGGYTIAGIAFVGINEPATPCASSSSTQRALFYYNTVHDVLVCDVEKGFLCIGSENGGPDNPDGNYNITERNNYLHDLGGQGWLGGGTSNWIMDSAFENNGFETGNLDHHIYMSAGGATDMRVTGNTLHANGKVGGGGCQNAILVAHGLIGGLLVQGNYFWEDPGTAQGGCYGEGLNPGYGSAEQLVVTSRGNVFSNVGGAGIDISACHGCVAEDNVCIGGPSSGFECIAWTNDGEGAGDWSNVGGRMSNNTAYGNGEQFRVSNGTGFIIANNVTQQTGTGTVNCFQYDVADANISFEDNNWCYAPTAAAVNWNATGPQTLATRRTHGFDLLSTQGTDPKFTNAGLSTSFAGAGSDFTPQSMSGLLAAGNAVNGSSIDFFGSAWIGVLPIGALQRAVTPSTPAAPGRNRPIVYSGWFLLTLFVLGIAALAGALSARRRRSELAEAQPVPLIDKTTQAALEEVGFEVEDIAGMMINRDPLLLPRKRKG